MPHVEFCFVVTNLSGNVHAVECQGAGHFRPIQRGNEDAQEEFDTIQIHDERKRRWVSKNRPEWVLHEPRSVSDVAMVLQDNMELC